MISAKENQADFVKSGAEKFMSIEKENRRFRRIREEKHREGRIWIDRKDYCGRVFRIDESVLAEVQAEYTSRQGRLSWSEVRF
jgi:hypothetical protein